MKTSELSEEVQLAHVGGMAVNYTGAGGVPAGTTYAATFAEFIVGDNERRSGVSIARFNPDGSFGETWSFSGNPTPSLRCGPESNSPYPTCSSQPGGSAYSVDVDVDQSTGNIYVYNGQEPTTGENVVHVYSPDGAELIGEFGERGAPFGESVAESPEKIHGNLGPSEGGGAIAVDASGDVYIYDLDRTTSPYTNRLMEFEPQSPGDYKHYVYAGQGHDLVVPEGKKAPQRPVFDAAGNIYTANEEGYIAEFDPSQPGAAPLCEFKFPNQGITAVTVDPENGEVFFASYKDSNHIHRLKPCEEGEFSEAGSIPFSPKRSSIGGLAFDPQRQFGAGRPLGVLYAGAASEEGGQSKKEGSETLFEASLGYIFAQPVETPPTVEGESFAHVTSTTAELVARVNPSSSATDYVFQYETEAQYVENEPSEPFAGAMESPLGGASAGDGNQAVAVTGPLVDLRPDTAYRFRVVATNHCSVADPGKICEASGEALAFRTFPIEAAGLPDHRAYELVSPADKRGGEVIPSDPGVASCRGCKPGGLYAAFPRQSAPDGDAVLYEGSAFDSEASGLSANQYIARRDPNSGWHTVNLTPTRLGTAESQGYKYFTANLSKGVLKQQVSTLSPDAPVGFQNLYSQSTDNPLEFTSLFGEGQIFHRSANEFRLEYAGASADLSRIFFSANDALTEETAFAPAAVDGGPSKNNLYEWHEGQLSLVNVLPAGTTQPGASFGVTSAHAISQDGTRVFFSDESGQVYVREDGEFTKEVTTEGVPDPGKFVVASTDGSKVLLSNGHLHDLGDEEPTIDLTQGKGGFQGVVGESEDLSRIYFVNTQILDETPNDRGEEAEVGKNNLYAWSRGEGTRFVARLQAEDNPVAIGSAGDWKVPAIRTAEASPGGRFLAFASKARLTGYDNTGPCAGNQGAGEILPGPCSEAFLYDSATDNLLCASCNPAGENPLGPSTLRLYSNQAGDGLPQPRYLTDEGRLLFDTRDSLLPADVNNGVEDVYEWEPMGVGGCESEFVEGGCASLVSAGTGTVDSNFVAMDETGANVFFTTRDQLALKDKDELVDLYDARVDGGIPAETEVARTECQGEACQQPVSPPNDPTPGSSTFEGAGNVHQEGKAKKHAHKHKKKRKRHVKTHKHAHKRAAKRNRGGAK